MSQIVNKDTVTVDGIEMYIEEAHNNLYIINIKNIQQIIHVTAPNYETAKTRGCKRAKAMIDEMYGKGK
jgi:hypothetical protein